MKYRVIKSRRRTLCLSVEKDGEILVRAPIATGDKEIEAFVIKHERWISARLAKRKGERRLSLNDGERITLFGVTYEIEEGKPKLENGIIFLPVNGRKEAFLKLIKRYSKEKMSALAESVSSRYRFEYSSIRISSARTRWGSCSRKGVLSFTCFLAFVPVDLAYYVAVHELRHTRHFDHSRNFWREVESVLPDWRSRRKALRKEEDCLNYLR